jgi:formate dehydrogenase major subunit
MKLRHAVAHGADVTIVTNDDVELNLPYSKIKTANSTDFLKQIAKALITDGCVQKEAVGFDELKNSLEKVKPGTDAAKLAEKYKAAKKAMILFNIEELSSSAAVEIANIAVISGHIGRPRDGIFMLKQMAGSQALADIGINKNADDIKGAKGLMIFGEDVDISSSDHEFLMVQDTHMTQAAKSADVVLPLAAFPEVDGLYANTERRLFWCEKAALPPFRFRTSEIVQKIAGQIEKDAPVLLPCELYPNSKLNGARPASGTEICVFDHESGTPKLQVLAQDVMYEALPNTSYLVNAAQADLRK